MLFAKLYCCLIISYTILANGAYLLQIKCKHVNHCFYWYFLIYIYIVCIYLYYIVHTRRYKKIKNIIYKKVYSPIYIYRFFLQTCKQMTYVFDNIKFKPAFTLQTNRRFLQTRRYFHDFSPVKKTTSYGIAVAR